MNPIKKISCRVSSGYYTLTLKFALYTSKYYYTFRNYIILVQLFYMLFYYYLNCTYYSNIYLQLHSTH